MYRFNRFVAVVCACVVVLQAPSALTQDPDGRRLLLVKPKGSPNESFKLLKLALEARLSVYEMEVLFQPIRSLAKNENKQVDRAVRLAEKKGAEAVVWVDFYRHEVSLSYDDGQSDSHYLRRKFDCNRHDFDKCVDAIAADLGSAISSWVGIDPDDGTQVAEPVYAKDNEISPLRLTNAGWRLPEPVLDLFVRAGYGPLLASNNMSTIDTGPHISAGTIILSRFVIEAGSDFFGASTVTSGLDQNEDIRLTHTCLTFALGANLQLGRFSFQPLVGLGLDLYHVGEGPDSATLVNYIDERAGISMAINWRLELAGWLFLWGRTGGDVYFEEVDFRVRHNDGSEETLLEYGTFMSRMSLGLEFVWGAISRFREPSRR